MPRKRRSDQEPSRRVRLAVSIRHSARAAMRVPAAILSLLFLTCCASTIPPSPALDIKSSRIEEHIGVPVPIAITIHNVGGAPISNWSAGISLQLINPVCYITGSLHQYEKVPWGHDVTPTIVSGQTATTQTTVTMSSY